MPSLLLPLLTLLSFFPLISLSWILLPSCARIQTLQNTKSSRHVLYSGPFFGEEEEFECNNDNDDDECEIDWDAMPTFSTDNEDGNEDTDVEDNVEVEVAEMEEEREDLVEMRNFMLSQLTMESRKKNPPTKKEAAMQRQRAKMDVNWQIEECKTDEDSCDDFCQECAGSGKMPCRFCRGTNYMVFPQNDESTTTTTTPTSTTSGLDDFRECIICQQGQEECSSCKGTGRIAPWATTMEQYLDSSEPVL